MKPVIGVFFGGSSVEHEVSVISGLQALNNLNREKYEPVAVYITRNGEFYTGDAAAHIEEYADIPALLKKCVRVLPVAAGGRADLTVYPPKKFGKSLYATLDAVLPVVHGTNVEDGALQGFFRTLGVPFAGCDVLASAVGMDKYVMKALFRLAGLPVLDAVRVSDAAWRADPEKVLRDTEEKLGFPIIVKPIDLGSSVGIKIANDAAELREALDYALRFTDAALAEVAVRDPREINCAVLGDGDDLRISECEEPVSAGEILSYEDKYVSGGKGGKGGGSKGMSGAKRLIPAPIPDEMREKVREYAAEAFRALGCSGVARIDFLLDGDKLYVNEINTIPGSLAFYLFEPTGLKYPELLDELIRIALARERRRARRSTSIETGILKNYKGGTKLRK